MEDQLAEGTNFIFKSAEIAQQMTERPAEKPSRCLPAMIYTKNMRAISFPTKS